MRRTRSSSRVRASRGRSFFTSKSATRRFKYGRGPRKRVPFSSWSSSMQRATSAPGRRASAGCSLIPPAWSPGGDSTFPSSSTCPGSLLQARTSASRSASSPAAKSLPATSASNRADRPKRGRRLAFAEPVGAREEIAEILGCAIGPPHRHARGSRGPEAEVQRQPRAAGVRRDDVKLLYSSADRDSRSKDGLAVGARDRKDLERTPARRRVAEDDRRPVDRVEDEVFPSVAVEIAAGKPAPDDAEPPEIARLGGHVAEAHVPRSALVVEDELALRIAALSHREVARGRVEPLRNDREEAREDLPARDDDVVLPVVVVIHGNDAPLRERERGVVVAAECLALALGEGRALDVAVERVWLVRVVRDVEIGPSVAVKVGHGESHAAAGLSPEGRRAAFLGISRPRLVRHVAEPPAALVVEERVAPLIVRDVEVGLPVAVVVQRDGADRLAARVPRAARVRHVREFPAAEVPEHLVVLPLVLVRRHEGRSLRLRLALGVRVEVVPDVDVRKAVAVDVESRESDRELPALEARLLHPFERPVALVSEDEIRLAGVADDEVREAVVVEIRPHRRHAPAARHDARMLRHVLERAVPAVPEEARALGERLRASRLPPLRGALHLLNEDEVEVPVAVEICERRPAAHRRNELGVDEVAMKAKPDAGRSGDVREQGARDVLPPVALPVQDEAARHGAARRDEDDREGEKPTHEIRV